MKITRKQLRRLILQETRHALREDQASAPDDDRHNVPNDEYRRRRIAEVDASSLEPSIKGVLNFILTNMEFRS